MWREVFCHYANWKAFSFIDPLSLWILVMIWLHFWHGGRGCSSDWIPIPSKWAICRALKTPPYQDAYWKKWCISSLLQPLNHSPFFLALLSAPPLECKLPEKREFAPLAARSSVSTTVSNTQEYSINICCMLNEWNERCEQQIGYPGCYNRIQQIRTKEQFVENRFEPSKYLPKIDLLWHIQIILRFRQITYLTSLACYVAKAPPVLWFSVYPTHFTAAPRLKVL